MSQIMKLSEVIEISEVSDHYPVFCLVHNLTFYRKINILLITKETNLNLILIYSFMIYIVLWILIL